MAADAGDGESGAGRDAIEDVLKHLFDTDADERGNAGMAAN